MGLKTGLNVCRKFRPTGIRSSDRPTRTESLYELSYPGPRCGSVGNKLGNVGPDALDLLLLLEQRLQTFSALRNISWPRGPTYVLQFSIPVKLSLHCVFLLAGLQTMWCV